MKYQWKRYWFWICAFLLGIITLIILKTNSDIATDVFFGGTAGLLTIFISTISHYRDGDKFFKELFTEFNQRYDKMNGFLNQITGNKELNAEEKQKIIDYFNLCAEEYMWVQKGRIPEGIWKSWKNGITTHLKKPSIKKLYDEEKEHWKSSYYGFFDEN